jgi:hypothetical protein
MVQGTRPARHHRHSSRLTNFLSTQKLDREVNGVDIAGSAAGNDRNAEALIKRILCADSTKTKPDDQAVPATDVKSVEELLPPLTSSDELNVQLYAIVAIILSTVVQAWYNKITPDSYFVNEIVRIIAHCTRRIEDRLKHVNLEVLLLDELPALLDAHLAGTTRLVIVSVSDTDSNTSRGNCAKDCILRFFGRHSCLADLSCTSPA